MHEPGKYKVHDAGLQAWLRYQKIQPLYWERDEHGVPLLVYEKTPVLMELVRMYRRRTRNFCRKTRPKRGMTRLQASAESRSYDSCNGRRNTWSRPLQPA